MSLVRQLGRVLAVPTVVAVIGTVSASGVPAAAAHRTRPDPQPVTPGIVLSPLPARYVLPVSGYRLTGRFGDSSGLWAHRHTGLDFATDVGTPIHAIADGVVVETTYDGAYGNKTVVRLGDGTQLWFCHQDRFAVSPGDHVRAGEVIGYVGATGNVTGPHVHVEVRPGGGEPVDPEPWLTERGLTP